MVKVLVRPVLGIIYNLLIRSHYKHVLDVGKMSLRYVHICSQIIKLLNFFLLVSMSNMYREIWTSDP